MSMSKPMSSVTTTSTAASATSTGMVMDHSGMDHSSMSMGGAKACKISMTWNWFTIDSCFLTKSWHVNTSAQFAGTCIGVVLMVILLEALRRSSKEYDALILREHMSKSQQSQSNTSVVTNDGTETEPTNNNSSDREKKGSTAALLRRFSQPNATAASFRPNLLQQGIRAFLHMLQFALAYFIMLMAMYYNGYIIISIFIGAYIGAFIFSWQSIGIVRTDNGIDANETTYCCG
ncbi:ctr copper transporter family protein [Venturia nashicola]|nr:ctr copper transporter family protein [Venturia nashicola]